jgi:hypothetical protein
VIAVHRAPSGEDPVVPGVEHDREAHLQHRVAGNDRLVSLPATGTSSPTSTKRDSWAGPRTNV